MLRNLLRDNTPIVDRIADENIEYFITWLVKQKNPDYLDFLSVLCVCEGRAMSRNQTLIMEKLMAAQQKQTVLMITKLVNGALEIRDRGTSDWKPFNEFLKDDQNRHFYESQLNLFANLAYGRNARNIEIITSKFISLDQVLYGLKEEHFRGTLRAAYSYALVNLFIDVGKNQPLLKRVQVTNAKSPPLLFSSLLITSSFMLARLQLE